MITLDTNLYLLCNLFNINSSKLSGDYSGMSVEDIMKAEAAQGNTAAASYSQIINDPAKLVELFELNNPGNKFSILSNMNQEDLDEMLPYLSSDDLVTGLNYFTKDKLLKMAEDLPQEQLVNYVFQMFSQEQLMSLMPQDQLNQVLTSPNMDKSLELKYLSSLKPEILMQMYEAATGQPIDYVLNQDISGGAAASNASASGAGASAASGGVNLSQPLKPVKAEIGLGGDLKNVDVANLINQVASLPDDKFKEAMISIPPVTKQAFVLQMAKENPNIYQMIDPAVYTDIIGQKKDKDDLVRCADVLQGDQLVKMVGQLPKDLTAVVLTQIDTNTFASLLTAKFKNVISEIMAG